MDAQGNAVLSWFEEDKPHFVQINADGTLGAERIISSLEVDATSVALDPTTGNFVICWSFTGKMPADGSGKSVFAQCFDRRGRPLGGEFQVNTTTRADQDADYLGAVAVDARGNVVVTWSGNGPGDDAGIFAQRFVVSPNPPPTD